MRIASPDVLASIVVLVMALPVAYAASSSALHFAPQASACLRKRKVMASRYPFLVLETVKLNVSLPSLSACPASEAIVLQFHSNPYNSSCAIPENDGKSPHFVQLSI